MSDPTPIKPGDEPATVEGLDGFADLWVEEPEPDRVQVQAYDLDGDYTTAAYTSAQAREVAAALTRYADAIEHGEDTDD